MESVNVQVGKQIQNEGLFAVTLDQHVAVGEFTRPAGSGGPALLKVHVPTHMPALWVAGAGSARYRYQYELLLPDQTVGTITEIEYSGNIPLITVKVGA